MGHPIYFVINADGCFTGNLERLQLQNFLIHQLKILRSSVTIVVNRLNLICDWGRLEKSKQIIQGRSVCVLGNISFFNIGFSVQRDLNSYFAVKRFKSNAGVTSAFVKFMRNIIFKFLRVQVTENTFFKEEYLSAM